MAFEAGNREAVLEGGKERDRQSGPRVDMNGKDVAAVVGLEQRAERGPRLIRELCRDLAVRRHRWAG